MNKHLRETLKKMATTVGAAPYIARYALRKEHAIIQQDFTPSGEGKSILVYTPPKCASTATHRIITSLAQAKDPAYTHINLFRYFYNNGIDGPDTFTEHVDRLILPNGIIYGPLRWGAAPAHIANCLPIVIIRDPRDMLVSLYYSMRDSHPLPMHPHTRQRLMEQRTLARNMDIDSFVLKETPRYKQLCDSFLSIPARYPTTLLLTYEEFVLDFDTFLDRLVNYLEIPKALIPEQHLRTLAHAGEQPTENTALHIRKRTPGDHKDKLTSETITILNREFDTVLNTIHKLKDHAG